VTATTIQLLSSGEFCKLRYDAVLVKGASAFLSITITQKYQIASCDSILLGVRYVAEVTDSELGDRSSITGRQELFG